MSSIRRPGEKPLDTIQQSLDLLSRSQALLRRPIYPWDPVAGVPADAPHFTHIFAHRMQAMTAMAHRRADGWELTIRGEAGAPLCTWRPDAALLREEPATTIPALLRLMAVMAQDGVLPLAAAPP